MKTLIENTQNLTSQKRTYEVYWIKHTDHTDLLQEGYVGITSAGVQYRFHQHKWSSGKNPVYPIHHAINKYPENIEVVTLCACEEDYAKALEKKLRPLPNIGWNINTGGQDGTADAVRQHWGNSEHYYNSEANKERLSENCTEQWQNDDIRKRRMEGIEAAWEDPDKVLGTDEWRHRISEGRKEAFKNNPELSQNLGNRSYYKDEDYLRRKSEIHKKVYEDRPDLREMASQRAKNKEPWENPRAVKDLWAIADYYYEYWMSSKDNSKKQATDHGLNHWSLQKIHKKFKAGWVPKEDSKWVLWEASNG